MKGTCSETMQFLLFSLHYTDVKRLICIILSYLRTFLINLCETQGQSAIHQPRPIDSMD